MHAMRCVDVWRYGAINLNYMDMSGELHVPAALPQEKYLRTSI